MRPLVYNCRDVASGRNQARRAEKTIDRGKAPGIDKGQRLQRVPEGLGSGICYGEAVPIEPRRGDLLVTPHKAAGRSVG